MGNNQGAPEEDFDPSDLSQWTLQHIVAIDRAARAKALEFAVTKDTFVALLREPYSTTINGIPVDMDAPIPSADSETIDYLWRIFSFVDDSGGTERVVPMQVLAGVVSIVGG